MTDIENLTEDIREIKHKLEQVQTILIEQALTKKELEQIRNDLMILESRVKCNEDEINKLKENKSSKYENIVKWIATGIGTILLGYIAVKLGLKQI